MSTEDTTLFKQPLIIILLVGTCQWLYFAACWKSSLFVLIFCCSCSQGLPPFTILITWLSKTVHSYQCTYLPSALTLAWWCTFCSPALFHSLSLWRIRVLSCFRAKMQGICIIGYQSSWPNYEKGRIVQLLMLAVQCYYSLGRQHLNDVQ